MSTRTTSRWDRVAPGRYRKEVSLTGAYVAEKQRDGRWRLYYEGAHSALVHTFPTFRVLKRYVEVGRGEV